MSEHDVLATLVAALLSRADIRPSEDELAQLRTMYRARQAELQALWAVPETRHEAPALRFSAELPSAEWSRTPDE